MTKKDTDLSQAKPCCYCCLRETSLAEHNNGRGLTYWLCEDCQGAGFKKVDGLYVLVCPCHGQQKHYDVANHRFMEKRAKAGYMYNYPVHTRHTKENGLKPMFGLSKYDEIKPT